MRFDVINTGLIVFLKASFVLYTPAEVYYIYSTLYYVTCKHIPYICISFHTNYRYYIIFVEYKINYIIIVEIWLHAGTPTRTLLWWRRIERYLQYTSISDFVRFRFKNSKRVVCVFTCNWFSSKYFHYFAHLYRHGGANSMTSLLWCMAVHNFSVVVGFCRFAWFAFDPNNIIRLRSDMNSFKCIDE